MNLLPRKINLRILFRHPLIVIQIYRLPLLILFVGALFDVLTTYRLVHRYGSEVEVHLVQRFVFDIFGSTLGVPLAKIAQLVCVILVVNWWRTWCCWILAICGLLYTLASNSNYFMLF